MSVPSNFTRIILKNEPVGESNLNLGESDSTFEITKATYSESDLKDGEVVIKTIYLSNDPSQRGWLMQSSRSYMEPVKVGEAMLSLGLGEVVASKSTKYSVGSKVTAKLTWAEYTVVHESSIFNVIDESQQLPLPFYLGTLGLTGLTAYFGLTEVGQVKAGQTVVISAASGATGSMAVQIAKHILGANVIGITGSDDKCKWVEEIGADKAFNYKSSTFEEDFAKYIGTNYVDAYYDNVGGKILDCVLELMKTKGRVIACGAIASYNDASKAQILNWSAIIRFQLTVQGFVITQFIPKFPQGIMAIVGAMKAGKIRAGEGFHVVDLSKEVNPWEQVPKTWGLLFSGDKPNGKLITKII